MPNHLAGERSAYLLQHQDNPVDWYPWGEEAFEKARRERKPVFLSIGYAGCHWCHVMAAESFESPAVAEILNRAFVSVKVDREERPDVDAVYMEACMAVNGSGGWPLTVLMTPEQRPFFAGTYLPRENRGRQPGLLPLLQAVAARWQRDPAGLEKAADELTAFLRREAAVQPADPDERLLRRAYEGGYCVMAKIAGKSAVENVSFHNGRHPWVVECHYTDPATGTVHVFYSRYLNVQVMDLLKSDEVPVYLDRMDQRVGFVDIDAVLPEIEVHGPGY